MTFLFNTLASKKAQIIWKLAVFIKKFPSYITIEFDGYFTLVILGTQNFMNWYSTYLDNTFKNKYKTRNFN